MRPRAEDGRDGRSAAGKPRERVPQHAPTGREPRLGELADELHHRGRQLAAARRLHRSPHLDRLLRLEALAGHRRLDGLGCNSRLGGRLGPGLSGAFGFRRGAPCPWRSRLGLGCPRWRCLSFGLRLAALWSLGGPPLGPGRPLGLGGRSLGSRGGAPPRSGSPRAGTLRAGARQAGQHARLLGGASRGPRCTGRKRGCAGSPASVGSFLFARGAQWGASLPEGLNWSAALLGGSSKCAIIAHRGAGIRDGRSQALI